MSAEQGIASRPHPEAGPATERRPGLGIQRAGYVALSTADPAAAAAFAVAHMGFQLVGQDDAGRHYLGCSGIDRYSLVYTPGGEGLDHVSYVVRDEAALEAAGERLAAAGVGVERIAASPPWPESAALRFRTPNGHAIQLAVGLTADVPIAAAVPRPESAPAPITCDHVVVRCGDVDAELAFAAETLGLMESSRIEAPGVGPVLAFFRARMLYHCLAIARADAPGLHHMQFTLKDGAAVFEAWERMRDDPAVDVVWDPVRHGPGHNIAFYFRDYAGNFVEYSAEEELILDDEHYAPMRWSALDQRSMDEWGTQPPSVFF